MSRFPTKHVRVDASLHHHLAVVAMIRKTTTQDLVNAILRTWAAQTDHSIEAEMRRSKGGE